MLCAPSYRMATPQRYQGKVVRGCKCQLQPDPRSRLHLSSHRTKHRVEHPTMHRPHCTRTKPPCPLSHTSYTHKRARFAVRWSRHRYMLSALCTKYMHPPSHSESSCAIIPLPAHANAWHTMHTTTPPLMPNGFAHHLCNDKTFSE